MESTGRDLARFLQLLQSFQCQKVPCDLLIRACESRPAWSSTGEIIDRLPLEAGVSKWLVGFHNVNKPFLNGTEPENYKGNIELTTGTDGVGYLELTSEGQPDLDVIDERILARERIMIILQAFPSINAEIIGEEIIERLMDVVKTSVLPLLSTLTEADIEGWLLPATPKERESFLVSMVEFLYQVIDRLGIENPLIPMPLLGQLSTAIASQTVANISIVSSRMSKVFDAYRGTNALQSSFWSSGAMADQGSNALIGYFLSMLLSNREPMCQQKALAESLAWALSEWRPLSLGKPSTMEYLAATSFCSQMQINMTGNPSFVTVDTIALRGMLLARGKQHKDAIEFLSSAMGGTTSQYGPCSMQLGIVTAELANCYNIIRQEDKAESCVRITLQGREGWSLSTRRDEIYLRLALADSLIGRARYSETVPVLESIIGISDISATFRMMSALRLARSRRRMHENAQKAFEHDSPFWTGSIMLGHVPRALEIEYIEELACSISEMHGVRVDISQEAYNLIEAVDSALCNKTSLADSPSWGWYLKIKKEYLGRSEIATRLKKQKRKGANKDTRESGKDRIGSPTLFQFRPFKEEADISDREGPWSERLVLSFDDGGVRSLSSLLILKHIIHRIWELEIDHPDGPAYSSSSYPWMGDQSGITSEPGISDWTDEFLPCHYFDYIVGISTGGWNAIMLGRLRMSIDDAISGLLDLVTHAFAQPRLLHRTPIPLLPWAKYSIGNTQEVFDRLSTRYQRRWEIGDINGDSDASYKLPWPQHRYGARTMVMSYRVRGTSSEELMWKSCDPESYGITVWQVASATSAGLPYFDNIKIGGSTFSNTEGLSDILSRSPLEEIHSLHNKSPAVFVSLGAGLGKPISANSFEPFAARKIDRIFNHKFPMFKGIDHLYRLNVPGDLLESRFDDWQDWTVQDIKDATEIYLGTAGVENDIDLIAKEAVRIRRARAQTERWEAFAINMHYTCSLCIRQTPVTFEDRPGLRAHLGESHADRDMSDQEVENFFNGCRKYRGRSG